MNTNEERRPQFPEQPKRKEESEIPPVEVGDLIDEPTPSEPDAPPGTSPSED